MGGAAHQQGKAGAAAAAVLLLCCAAAVLCCCCAVPCRAVLCCCCAVLWVQLVPAVLRVGGAVLLPFCSAAEMTCALNPYVHLACVAAVQVAGNFHFAPGRSYQQGSMHVHDL